MTYPKGTHLDVYAPNGESVYGQLAHASDLEAEFIMIDEDGDSIKVTAPWDCDIEITEEGFGE